MSHEWKKKHFSKPTWCAFCNKFIWGLGKQGYVCKQCTFPAHPKCMKQVSTSCPKTKTQHQAQTLQAAKDNSKSAPKTKSARSKKTSDKPKDSYVPDVDVNEEEKKVKSKPRPLVTQGSVVKIDAGKEEVVEGAASFEDVYDMGQELGRGAFSIVYRATLKSTGEAYAVKVIKKKNVKQDLHRLQIEMNILKAVDHPNIIKLKNLFETPETLYIVTEVVSGGELFDRIVNKGSYSERDAATLIAKLCRALEYLHEKGIVHRDLKPENLLLKSEEEDNEIKLADFGLSKIVGEQVMLQTACGTPGYVAPEVLKAAGYGKEVDMWSTGVIAYILLCGFPPFYHDNVPLLFESIMTADYDYPPDYWDEISDEAIDFIDSLLVIDPKQRLTATQALEHPWLKGAAPEKQLSIGSKLTNTLTLHKEQSKAGWTDADATE